MWRLDVLKIERDADEAIECACPVNMHSRSPEISPSTGRFLRDNKKVIRIFVCVERGITNGGWLLVSLCMT